MAMPFHIPDEYFHGCLKSAQSLLELLGGLHADPIVARAGKAQEQALPLVQIQMRYWEEQMALWTALPAFGAAGGEGSTSARGGKGGDRRFHARAWHESPWHSLLMQNYLIHARLLADLVERVGCDDKDRNKLRFFTQQFIDAMSPANFAGTNPEAIGLALETSGESLRQGLANLLEDLGRGRIAITDETAFEVGRNVATSEGAVIFENGVMQLIQYAPQTGEVAARPLVIVPPCINKFYILDLQPENSFVRFACEQGYTVFLVSWCNDAQAMKDATWDDYVEQGVMKAIEVARAVAGADKVNTVGWCVGGTLLSSALALLRGRGDRSVASMTLLTTMLDFEEPGDLGAYVDEQMVQQREQTIGRGGIYPGRELGFVFQTLRANDLIWPYVVNNYLKGKSPAAFDLLYWNADGTNLPGPMYAWYLRNMYLENNLRTPGRLSMCGDPVDLGRIDMPSYVLATQEDHIVPWKSAYRTMQLVSGKSEFVLGASGHIAGVINPASRNKRSYWTGGKPGADADAWLAQATPTPGSWWTHWNDWLGRHAGKPVPARTQLGNSAYPPVEPAPGRYVKVRCD
ncbi:class I poly(R)-hydroxyalkanoic acid synthase [Cupriavidus numazuensis]|uniref:Poly(3-hydroxyalkanoate) polymerase subunit PhaC n=1 Tax=Cupriavidus numazuensis TaxID=221992 RepID=A0ABM8TBX7_9BURK|nr:class I poly(R)-hydroxyalkanoic acid synthase [Cupriavidus numazuensis]CAG2134387.1 Poly(3-hydroxyalkanoate) polymerase subunit PhaC [Cupriavidus numazuensis]